MASRNASDGMDKSVSLDIQLKIICDSVDMSWNPLNSIN